MKAYISNYYTFHPFSVYAVNIQGFHGIPVLAMLILTLIKVQVFPAEFYLFPVI